MGVATALPGGYWHQGQRYQKAELRSLAGADEAFLAEEVASAKRPQRITALLARCVQSLGPLRRVPVEAVRSLTVGDREALVLQLRGLAFGDRMDCVIACPSCEERLDLELRVSELLLPPDPHRQEWYEIPIANGDAYRVRFRLPNGADEEAAAELAASDPQGAATLILERCVALVSDDRGEAIPVDAWPETVAREIPERMAQLDPQAEIELRLRCPACEQPFCTLFDPADYMFREIAARSHDLYREVHLIALYYHWSERDILGLTPGKRSLYLRLLEEGLGDEVRQ